MSDAMADLFTAALGLAAPWRVAQVRFAPEAHEIHFDLICDAKRCRARTAPRPTSRSMTG
jgi:hypothetical protein